MPNIGDSERKTQNRVIEFFQTKLHYRYIGNLKDQANRNIDEKKLTRPPRNYVPSKDRCMV